MKLRWGLVLTSTLFLSLFLSGHADAQQKQGTPARVAWVSVLSLAQVASYLDAFRSGLAAEGYVEGSDIEVLARSADGDSARLSAVVDEVVSLKPDVIITKGAAIFGVRKVTQIPVVYGFSGDPVAAKLTDSMARPSRNLTGVSFMAIEMNAKRLDLLRTVSPQPKRVVLMGDPIHPGVDLEIRASEDMARQLGMEVRWVPTRNLQEVSDLLAKLNAFRRDARGRRDAGKPKEDCRLCIPQAHSCCIRLEHIRPERGAFYLWTSLGGKFQALSILYRSDPERG